MACVITYGLIVALTSVGLSLMAFSMLFAFIFDAGFFSGFGLLTGGIIFTAGGILFLWKVARELESFCQSLEDAA